MKKTKKLYEKYLNRFIYENYTEDEAVENWGYLSLEKIVRNNYKNKNIGSLFRKKDPIAFNVGFNEWEYTR